jgi:hypothetical protein
LAAPGAKHKEFLAKIWISVGATTDLVFVSSSFETGTLEYGGITILKDMGPAGIGSIADGQPIAHVPPETRPRCNEVSRPMARKHLARERPKTYRESGPYHALFQQKFLGRGSTRVHPKW